MVFSVPLNYTAIFTSAVIAMVLGFVWYHPKVFGSKWQKYAQITKNDTKDMSMSKSYLIMFLGALVMSYVTAHFVYYVNAQTAADGAIAGFWLWLGFVATTGVGDVLFGGKNAKPWGMYLLQNGHNLVLLSIMGAVLTVWR